MIVPEPISKQTLDKSCAVEAFVTAGLISIAIAFIVVHVIAVLCGIDTVTAPGDVFFHGL